jgi:hypothetical protein
MKFSQRHIVLSVVLVLITLIAATIIYTLIRSTTIQKDLESRYGFTQLKTEIARALSSSVNCTTSFKDITFKGDQEFISAPLYYDDGAGNKRHSSKIIEVNDIVEGLAVKKAGIEIGTSVGKGKYKGKYIVELQGSLRAEFNVMFATKDNSKTIATCISANLAANIGFCPPRNSPHEVIGTWKRKKSGEQYEQSGDPFAKLTKTYFCPAKTVLLTATFNCHYKWKWEYQDNNKSPIYASRESFFPATLQAVDPSTLLVSCEIPRSALDECAGPVAPYDDPQSYGSSCRLFQSYAEGSLTCCPTGE